jgi:hypothetical protein
VTSALAYSQESFVNRAVVIVNKIGSCTHNCD